MATKRKGDGNVPNLRFPGFEAYWEEKRLGDLLEFKNGINASKEQYGTGIKFINVLDILNNDYLTYERIVGKVNVDSDMVNKYPVKYGDLLFQRSSETREEVGTANVYLDKKHTATFGGFVIRGKKISDYDPIFLNKLLKTNAARDSITSRSGGSTRYNVGQDILSSVVLKFPCLSEQEKVGEFLTLIDKRINTQSKIIEQLETLIKGLCETLFSEKVRFNKFTYEWKLMNLEKVLVKNSIKNKNQKYSVVQSVSNKYGFINQDEMFEDRRVASIDTSNYYVIGKGCFAYNPSRINVGSLAYKDDDETTVISPLYISFKANNNFIVDRFLWYWFRTVLFTRQMNNSFEGSVRNTLSYENLIRINISIPSLEEQIKIVELLSLIDGKIHNERNLLDKHQSQKKHLLNNLFI